MCLLFTSCVLGFLFVWQELAVLQEELDILMTRKEDYEAVSGLVNRGRPGTQAALVRFKGPKLCKIPIFTRLLSE